MIGALASSFSLLATRPEEQNFGASTRVGATPPKNAIPKMDASDGAQDTVEIESAGFRIDTLDSMYLPGTPRFAGFNYWGSARTD